MSVFHDIFSFSRSETIALVVLTALLLIGGGILFYEKTTQSLPPELLFESLTVNDTLITPGTVSSSPISSPTRFRSNYLTHLESVKVNLNTCPLESLTILPEIGPAIGKRIIEYRQSHNGFDSVGQLIDVNGIGPKKLAVLRKYLKVR